MILHISHTNIQTDARILREMETVACFGQVIGLGLKRENIFDLNLNTNLKLYLLSTPITNYLRILPRIFRYIALYPLFLYLEIFIRSFITLRNKRIKVIHCHDYLMLPISVFLKIYFRCKLVYDAHELESLKNGVNKFSSLIIFLLEKILWSNLDAFITVSPRILNWYSENFKIPISEIIYNVPPIRSNPNYKLITDVTKINFVYVGLLVRGRGIENILKCFSHETPHSVTFVGDGDLTELIKSYSNEYKNIQYSEPIFANDLPSYLSKYDVGFCTIPSSTSLSDYYSLPNKLFEYLFAGLVIVATDLPEINDVLSSTGRGVVIKNENFDMSYLTNNLSHNKFSLNPNLDNYLFENQQVKLRLLYNKLNIN